MVDNLWARALLTGVLFGMWPLLMNRSGLDGSVSSLVLAVITLACILPFSVGSIGSIFGSNINLTFAIIASVLGGFGILLLNGILAKTTPQTVSSFLVFIFVVQIAVPSIYHFIVTGGLTITKGLGFAFSIAAAILLTI